MTHLCHAVACRTPCRPEHLMCPKHWNMVPAYVQSRVYRAYRPGQCDDMLPSPEWHEAADLALGYVALMEGRLREMRRSLVRAVLKNDVTYLKTACTNAKYSFDELERWATYTSERNALG